MKTKLLAICLIALGLASSAGQADAKLKIKHPCMDSMVLQQNSEASVWGFADAGAEVTVRTSWNKASYRVKADDDGIWRVKVRTCAAGYTPYRIDVRSGKDKMSINDVLIGEVWFASGQSNMEMPMHGWDNTPADGYVGCLMEHGNPDAVRMYMGNATCAYEPQNEFTNGRWLKAEGDDLGYMSATAYWFARRLNEKLGVPIGMVTMSYGGTRVEGWLPREIASEIGEVCDYEDWKELGPYRSAFGQYNAMIKPMVGYTIRGFIWYQGCSNYGEHASYADHFSRMVAQWRKDWEDSSDALPFYAVEIAPFNYDHEPLCETGALIRQAQIRGTEITPNCEIIGTNDLVKEWESIQIHPSNKIDVGDRLARLALNRDYGFSYIPCYCPHAIKCARTGNGELWIYLSHIEHGLNSFEQCKGLELAGEDGVFYPADWLYTEGSVVHAHSDKVPQPCAARYCWGNMVFGNISSQGGLPVLTFYLKAE